MVAWPVIRRSAITFDLGAGGTRACQMLQRGSSIQLCESLSLEHAGPAEVDGPKSEGKTPQGPPVDPAQLERLIERGAFTGRDVALVLSPPEVQFIPLRLPPVALGQSAERIEQALKFEVAQESRKSADELEVRYWLLPPSRSAQANVMAVVASAQATAQWSSTIEHQRLTLRRIDVSPTALVHLARRAWTPAAGDLWGVLDLGLRRCVLTIVVGSIPTYIRVLSASGQDWTRRLAQAFEVPEAVAEQLKRQHGLHPHGRRRTDAKSGGGSAVPPLDPGASDLGAAFFTVLHDPLQNLAQEVGRCFAYVMQSYPEVTLKRLWLAGGGAALGGLAPVLEHVLGMSVEPLVGDGTTDAWEQAIGGASLKAHAAAAAGGALLQLQPASAGDSRGGTTAPGHTTTPSINAVPVTTVQAHCRQRRTRVWVAVCLAGVLLLATGWSFQRAAAGALTRFAERVSNVETQRGEVQRRLVVAASQRAELVERLRTTCAARRPQPWAQRLVHLTRAAPETVFLTQVSVTMDGRGAQTPPAAPAPAATARRGETARREADTATRPNVESQTVRLLGYAVDHAALLQMLNSMQSLPDWKDVELVRATQEPFRGGEAVAFELACRAREDGP